MLLRGFDDHVARLLDAEINHAKTVVGENDVHQIFSDVVDISLYRGQHDSALLRAGFFFHLGLEIGHGCLHHARRVEHRGQLHFARAEQVPHGLHSIEQYSVDQVEGGVGRKRIFQQLLERFFMRAFADRLLAVDDGEFQLVFNRKRVHMRGG